MDVKRWLKNEKDSEDFLSRKLTAMGEILLFMDFQKVRIYKESLHLYRSAHPPPPCATRPKSLKIMLFI